ncbi:alkylated DNA repair dioxygenase AlkB [Catalinimonas alkaloidigena]|uniref:alpha-ketoglutarate-dependent dioxygenase AlkB family protein n=1 Tax=Catalinimonas alkaloidigena TaxID=1075417 RepID=UPI0024075E11|nr:alpha-ketoglutarate-dependent dioxygenase AlkB [Catalinimonas alkaloidigena]MDF9798101.1 alkylated DNA repair dioxygenase AlkB [Catalinimonas alkaloidigena]
MNLFSQNEIINHLPYDGEVYYYGNIIRPEVADNYYEKLMHRIAWKYDEAVMFGKHIVTKRKVAWYGDEDYSYTYSNATKQALAWTEELLELKQLVEKHCDTNYNSCLLNLYHDGEEGMAWHSDDEKALAKDSSIASLSLGAARKFAFKHKESRQTISLILAHGSLLEMKGTTQTYWWHRLPKTKKVKRARINLTFRRMEVA